MDEPNVTEAFTRPPSNPPELPSPLFFTGEKVREEERERDSTEEGLRVLFCGRRRRSREEKRIKNEEQVQLVSLSLVRVRITYLVDSRCLLQRTQPSVVVSGGENLFCTFDFGSGDRFCCRVVPWEAVREE